jgi:DNA-binding NarL/FixJ family response regulator
MQNTVLLVEDHTILREGLRQVISKTSGFKVVGEAGDGVEGIDLARELRPDIVLLDLGLPKMYGLDVLVELQRHCPATKVIILTMSTGEELAIEAFRNGASAYVVKQSSVGELIEALVAVSGGGYYLSSQVSEQVLARIRRGDPADAGSGEAVLTRASVEKGNSGKPATAEPEDADES